MRLKVILTGLIPLGLACVGLQASAHPAPVAAKAPDSSGLWAPPAGQPLPPAGEGRRLFMKYNCYSCHGMYAGGGMGPNLRGEAEAGDVREAIQHGEDKGMRAFNSYFSAKDLDNMVAYFRSLGTR